MIAAAAENLALGKNNKMVWHLPDDFKRFKQLTSHHFIIMGRKTFESLVKPLPNRTHIIITRQKNFHAEGAEIAGSVDEALRLAGDVAETCIIGGGEIYQMFLPLADRIYLTEVDLEVSGDTFAPKLNAKDWHEVSREVHVAGPKDSADFVLRTLQRK